jgi:hypothetical protein
LKTEETAVQPAVSAENRPNNPLVQPVEALHWGKIDREKQESNL